MRISLLPLIQTGYLALGIYALCVANMLACLVWAFCGGWLWLVYKIIEEQSRIISMNKETNKFVGDLLRIIKEHKSGQTPKDK